MPALNPGQRQWIYTANGVYRYAQDGHLFAVVKDNMRAKFKPSRFSQYTVYCVTCGDTLVHLSTALGSFQAVDEHIEKRGELH